MDWLLDWIDLPRLILLAVIFVPLERIFSIHRRPWRRSGMSTDLVYALVGTNLIKLGFALILIVAFTLREAIVPAVILDTVRSQPQWVQFLEVVIISDLCFYWVHRLFHSVPALWRFHAIHHSIEEMDWLAGHRVHPVDQVLTKGAAYLPVVILGFSDPAATAAALLYGWHSVLLHSNISIPLRFVEGYIATPNFHHWHHSNERKAWDKNFAGQLAFLDQIFGTAYMPEGHAPERYGVDDPLPRTYLGQLLYPFRRPSGPQASHSYGRTENASPGTAVPAK